MKKFSIKHYNITSEKIPLATARVRVVFISDLHNVSIGKHNQVLLDQIDSLSPDLVLLGGDTIVAKPGQPMEVGLRFISDLAVRHQVYAANGNHEYRMRIYPEVYGTMYSKYLEQLDASGVILLENSNTKVCVGEVPIVIHGLELDREYYHRFDRPELTVEKMNDYLGTLKGGAFHILLAHNPCHSEAYAKWGPDLILSGHYHGGVIRTFKDRALIGNEFRLFPPYAYGHYELDQCHVITSAGLGEHTIPIRIHNPRELVVVDIIPQTDAK